MRVLGAAMIFLAFSASGICFSDRIRKKRERLAALIYMLEETVTLIRWNSLTLREIAAELSAEKTFEDFSFVKKLYENISGGMSFPKGWEEAVAADKFMSLEEKQLLSELGCALGTTDKKGQISVIGLYRERLCGLLSKETEKYRIKGKMYRSLGIATGAMIGIIMI